MNIKRTITTTVLAASMALTAALPAVAQNSSENGHGTRTTREGKVTATNSTRVRGDMEGIYLNYGTGNVLMFLRMDLDDRSTAEMMVDMFSDPDFVAAQLDTNIEGTFKVRGLGNCAGVYGEDGGFTTYIAVCQDGVYLNTVMGSDKDEVLDVMEGVQLDGELVLPRGYEEYEG